MRKYGELWTKKKKKRYFKNLNEKNNIIFNFKKYVMRNFSKIKVDHLFFIFIMTSDQTQEM